MYGCESWTIKKAECQSIGAFELLCWRRLFRFPWTARRSNQPILKKISPEYSLGGLMLKFKLQHFGHLMWRTDSLEKTLILGKIQGRKRKRQQRMRWVDDLTDLIDMSLSKLWELVMGWEDWCAAFHGVTKCWTWVTKLNCAFFSAPVIEETVLSPLCILASCVLNELTLSVWVYFWALYCSIDLYVCFGANVILSSLGLPLWLSW